MKFKIAIIVATLYILFVSIYMYTIIVFDYSISTVHLYIAINSLLFANQFKLMDTGKQMKISFLLN